MSIITYATILIQFKELYKEMLRKEILATFTHNISPVCTTNSSIMDFAVKSYFHRSKLMRYRDSEAMKCFHWKSTNMSTDISLVKYSLFPRFGNIFNDSSKNSSESTTKEKHLTIPRILIRGTHAAALTRRNRQ